jgi:hypothetical protein
MTSLRYRLGIPMLLWRQYLYERSIRHPFCDLCIAVTKNYICKFPKGRELILFNVADILLFKTIDKHGALLEPEENDGTNSGGLTFTGACNALFDNAATQIRIDRTLINQCCRLPKRDIADSRFPCETSKRLCLVDGQCFLGGKAHAQSIALSAI